MSSDEHVRRSADALATELGRDIQQALGRFLDEVLTSAAQQREALQTQLAQVKEEAEARVEQARAEARAAAEQEREHAMAGLETTAAARLAEAVAQARAEAGQEAERLVASARDEAAQATARLADEDARRAEAAQRAFEEQTRERDASLASQERLVESFRRLDSAPSLTALLDTLAEAAGGEARRSAVLLVRGRELHGWRVSGVAPAPADVRGLSVPLDAAGDLAACVRTGQRAEVHADSLTHEALAFLRREDAGVGAAVPVTVGGDVAAIVYGDDGGEETRTVPAGWPESLELLARHAARCLEAQTAIRAARLGGAAASAAGPRAADSRIERGATAGHAG
jgi:hypothetical protein